MEPAVLDFSANPYFRGRLRFSNVLEMERQHCEDWSGKKQSISIKTCFFFSVKAPCKILYNLEAPVLKYKQLIVLHYTATFTHTGHRTLRPGEYMCGRSSQHGVRCVSVRGSGAIQARIRTWTGPKDTHRTLLQFGPWLPWRCVNWLHWEQVTLSCHAY